MLCAVKLRVKLRGLGLTAPVKFTVRVSRSIRWEIAGEKEPEFILEERSTYVISGLQDFVAILIL